MEQLRLLYTNTELTPFWGQVHVYQSLNTSLSAPKAGPVARRAAQCKSNINSPRWCQMAARVDACHHHPEQRSSEPMKIFSPTAYPGGAM